MKPLFAALVAAAGLASLSAPAAACDFFSCPTMALANDASPPWQPHINPLISDQVRSRFGKGMSLAGFYNDPGLAIWRVRLAQRAGLAPAPGQPSGYVALREERGHAGRGPKVIYSPYGH